MHSKRKAPGFSWRHATAALGGGAQDAAAATSFFDLEHSDQHGDLMVPLHKERADICGRRLLTKQHLHCKYRIPQKFQIISSAATVNKPADQTEPNFIAFISGLILSWPPTELAPV